MKTKLIPIAISIITILFLTSGGSAAPGTSPLGTAFTYQGHLDRDGTPYTGLCDFNFSLWDDSSSGSQLGSTIPVDDQIVSEGMFTTQLDFGAEPFNGYKIWLKVDVKCDSESVYTELGRQELTATPYAIYAKGAGTANYAVSAPWAGLTGVPAGFMDNVDNDTLPTWSGLTGIPSGFADNVDNDTTYDGRCNVGSYIYYLHNDGSFDCQPDATLNRFIPPAGTTVSTVDPASATYAAGRYSSLTIGTDGLGLISSNYYDTTISNDSDLKVSHCGNIDCTNSTTTYLDTSGNVGFATSIAIGTDGLGLISYLDDSNTALKVAHCDNVTCSSAIFSTVDADNYGRTSITIGSDGYGLISYCSWLTNTLKVAHCDNTACTSSSIATIDTLAYGCSDSSITTGLDGYGLIAYGGSSLEGLHVAHCNDFTCSSSSRVTYNPADNIDEGISITIGSDGLGLISYSAAGSLIVAHCDNTICSTANLSTLDSSSTAKLSSITIGADGLGMISYYDYPNHYLKLAKCTDIECVNATITKIGPSMYLFDPLSLTIGIDGYPLISMHTGNLTVVHCSNELCIPYFRRR
jgi:hypothetical protein